MVEVPSDERHDELGNAEGFDVRIDPADHSQILIKTHPGRNFFVTISITAVVAALLTYAVKTLPGRDAAPENTAPLPVLKDSEAAALYRPPAEPVPSLMMDAVQSYMDGRKK